MARNQMDTIDPTSGFDQRTKIYHSLRPRVSFPPADQPLSITEFAFSLLHAIANDAGPTFYDTTTFAVFQPTGEALTFRDFINRTRSLAYSLRRHFSLVKNDAALIISPPSLNVLVLYFALVSLGVIVSPINPLSSDSEVAHQIGISKPVIAFATAREMPSLRHGTVLINSPEFNSWLTHPDSAWTKLDPVIVDQSDTAAILFSSGTTGRVKGVNITHRNLIALIAGYYHLRHLGHTEPDPPHPVALFTLPLFHVFGFFMLLKAFAQAETLVLLERFDFVTMLKSVEKYRVTYIPVSPPIVVAMLNSEVTNKFDLSSLVALGCGGAPLGKEVAVRFRQKFPNIKIVQGYGLTETSGSVTRLATQDEMERHGSAGRLETNLEAMIVDPTTGQALSPGHKGELWLRSPSIMKGYVGNNAATAETLDSDGWLKTGDLCYFDSEGFLYITDRLKELIKYKGFQVPPAELEQMLLSYPEIADAAVIGYPDEAAGQIPMAFVVRKPGSSITEAQVMDFVAKQVAPYKKIRRVVFIDAIPKSAAGKILKKELVGHAGSGQLAKL